MLQLIENLLFRCRFLQVFLRKLRALGYQGLALLDFSVFGFEKEAWSFSQLFYFPGLLSLRDDALFSTDLV